MLRAVIWVVLILAGVCAVLVTITSASAPVVVVTAVGVVGLWIAFGMTDAYYAGIRRHVARHLGRGWHQGEVVRYRVRTGERVNLQMALDELRPTRTPYPTVFGFTTHIYPTTEEAVGTELVPRILNNPEPKAIVWEAFPRGIDRVLNCANNALYLLHCNGEPTCAVVEGQSVGARKPAVLLVLARTREIAQSALDTILRLARERSPYKGAVISIQRSDRRRDDFTVQFHDLAPVARGDIILPHEVMNAVDRNVLGFLRHREALRTAERATRHGVLLHGPPGTGKTLVTRYLARSCSPCTVLLLSGRQYAYLRPTCQLARLLAPSVVVLEDSDLIAAKRDKNRHAPLLHELMDEMDGLGPDVDCVFLLTTNRPEALEPALVARPGRIDQAIYFPLPDLECRRRLFTRFGVGLDVSAVDLAPLLARTEGASPAFLKELFRRASLRALERGEGRQPLRLVGDDFENGLRELIEVGGELTRNFLGFPAPQRGG